LLELILIAEQMICINLIPIPNNGISYLKLQVTHKSIIKWILSEIIDWEQIISKQINCIRISQWMINLMGTIKHRINILIVNLRQDLALELFHTEIVFIFLVGTLEKEELILMIYFNIKCLKNNGTNWTLAQNLNNSNQFKGYNIIIKKMKIKLWSNK
jgi:hypothetical protein